MKSIEDGFVDILFVFWEPLFLHYMFFADGLKHVETICQARILYSSGDRSAKNTRDSVDAITKLGAYGCFPENGGTPKTPRNDQF